MRRSNPKVRPIVEPADPLENGRPCNLDVERWILGAILRDGVERWILGAILRDGTGFAGLGELVPADFALEKHRRIFAAVCRVHEDGEPINYATVYAALQQEQWAESCDGLSGLADMSTGVPDKIPPETQRSW